MPEEVTYATLKFPSKLQKLQESGSLKRPDNHEVPELELDNAAENGPRRTESTVEMSENRAMRGILIEQSVPSKVWGTVAFILLMLNLLVLAGLGTLILMNFHKLFSSNGTAYDRQQSTIEQLERNVALYMDMYKNVSSEHFVLKNTLKNMLKQLNNVTSKCSEDLKEKKNDLKFCSCLKSCTGPADKKKNFSTLSCYNEKNGNRTQGNMNSSTTCPVDQLTKKIKHLFHNLVTCHTPSYMGTSFGHFILRALKDMKYFQQFLSREVFGWYHFFIATTFLIYANKFLQ